MKSLLPALLVFSLAANAVLFIKLPPAGEPRPGPPAASASDDGLTLPRDAAAAPSGRRGTPLQWTDLPAHDLPALIASLRAGGFPPSVIHSVVNNEIAKLQADRLEALQRMRETPYWKNAIPGSSPEYRAANRELLEERNRLMRELLGEQFDTEESRVAQRNRFGNLPPEKIEVIQLIVNDYNDLTAQVHGEAQGMLLAQDREKLAYLERERQADLRALLTADEHEEYLLHTSSTASQMRSRLIGMEPSEQEFRAIFALQRAFDEEYATPRSTPEWQARRREAEQKLLADVRAALGEERGAEYERSRDPTYVQAMQFARNQQLPKETGMHVWEVQRDIQQRARALQTNRALSPEERNARLTALAQEATTQLSPLLGDSAFEAYRSSAGSWLPILQSGRVLVPATQ